MFAQIKMNVINTVLQKGRGLSRRALYIVAAVVFTLSWSLPSLFWPEPAAAAISFRSASPAVQNSGTSITIDKPAGTVEGDVMVATITAVAVPAISLAGWTSIVRTTESTNAVMETFWKTAGASEPASYSFSLGLTATAAVGGIASYVGADTLAPVDNSGGNSSGLSKIGTSEIAITANSINVTSHNAVLIASFAISTQTGFAPPAGMEERYDAQSNCGTLCTNVTGASTDVSPITTGPSGNKSATTQPIGDGTYSLIGQQIALRPPTLDGNGLMIYGENGSTTPRIRDYDNFRNTFSAEANTLAGSTGLTFMLRTSPIKREAIAGYVNSSGTLQIMCYNGTAWSNEWTASVGGTGTTRRFDIAYETETGDVMVLYGTNAGTTNELAYRAKAGGSGCGGANWAGVTNLDPVRTSGVVHWVKASWDRRSTSNLITAIWADANADLSAMVWSGSAWGNEPAAALETSLEVVAVAQDVDDFDVEYESLSGDVMVVWANSAGANGTNGSRFATCNGGAAACTWSAPAVKVGGTDDATNLDIAGDPNSDRIIYGAIGDAGSDLSAGYWDGTAWLNMASYTNVDMTCDTPVAGTRLVSVGWVASGGTTRGVLVYADAGATNIGWYTFNDNLIGGQSDVAPTPAFGSPQKRYDIQMDPVNKDRLMFTLSDVNNDLFAKRLSMNSAAAFSWTNADGGAALEAELAQSTVGDFAFAYWQHSSFEQAAYRWFANADSLSPGAALSARNTSVEPSSGPFRLRMLLHIGGTSLLASERMLKLQVSPKSGTCDTAFVGETYVDIGSRGSISSSGPRSAGTGANSGIGTSWSNPGNVTASDDSRAEAVFTLDGDSADLKATNFGFNIPSDATISGIVAEVERSASGGVGVTDKKIAIVKGGTISATNRADTITVWPTADAYKSYGSSTDLWGETWAPADINSSEFGLAVAASSPDLDVAGVDNIRITVHYTAAGTDAIVFKDNATPADKAAIGAIVGDPAHGTHITVPQTYNESNTFTSQSFTPNGQDGLWDFALTVNGAFGGYCFRVVNSDGRTLDSYTYIPEIVFCDVPRTENVMRGGNYFCNESKRKFYWSP
jgi:hypothetical protein